ncbi:aspartate--tRNA ligase [Natroniella acetigena]|uniref:aspartate--tRNA ligase n=1 Tax=Natroniella acetigena TaxID=52004 RepID=UPI0024A7ECDB|nr:aspartate--tRNA ligase [Natroniella acetigena]
MKDLVRTHSCKELGIEQVGEEVTLMGWVQRRRDHGGVIFVDLRDRFGLVQVVFNPEIAEDTFDLANQLRKEYVIAVTGEVIARPEEMINDDLNTGKIEVHIEELHILDEAETPPFLIEDEINVGEEVRLKYRYLDLRRKKMQENLMLRHQVKKSVRDYLDREDFLEIETPMLTKSTPEGARDFLVPSRLHTGEFFALPQSPQLFKQLLMVSGMERYYQIVRCFRDEDLRADRQPEFTQIDLETSFMNQEEILELVEKMMKEIFTAVDFEVPTEFPRMTYQEAIERYGTDRPDTRFGMELVDLSEVVKNSEFNVFSGTVANGGLVKGINAKGAADFSRKDIDELTDFVGIYGAKGLAWIKVEEDGVNSQIAKFLAEEELNGILDEMEAEAGDLLLFVADNPDVVAAALGNLRLELAKKLELIDQDQFEFLWVTDFPLLEWDDEAERYVSLHHPFTMPKEEELSLLDTAPEEVTAQAYDLVLNGIEIGGGSIRINNRQIQEKIFGLLEMEQDEIEEKFSFLLEAFEYGAPPHGGIAFGLDRLVMLLGKLKSIRDVIAFPKTQRATCILTDAPSPVAKEQLEELNLEIEEEIELD